MDKDVLTPEKRAETARPVSIFNRFRAHLSWKHTFTALRYRNYRLWFWGQMISLFGSWMQSTAQGFLIYELTHSPVFLGYVGFAAGIPSWLFMLYGGVIADRLNRRTLLIITQTAMMVLAFILAGLAFSHMVQPWHIILMAFLLGVANAFDAPARQAFILEMVSREDLTNAIALNSTMFNTATAIGPAASGIIYALLGPAWCFTVNGISFLAVIAALLMMRIDSRPPNHSLRTRGIDELKEGILYVRSHAMIRTLITMVLITTLFGLSFATLIPAWAVETLRGNAATNGWLQSARGIGALISALLIASLGRFNFRGRLLTLGSFAFPIMLAAFSFIRRLPLSLVLILGIGMSSILIFNLCNSLVQTLVQDSLRGRVMGIYSLTFFGTMPIGAILVGLSAQLLGEPAAIVINAAIMMAFSILIWIMAPKLRRLE